MWSLLLSTRISQTYILCLFGTLENTMVIDLGYLLCTDGFYPIYSGIISKVYFGNSHFVLSDNLYCAYVTGPVDPKVFAYCRNFSS